MAVRKISLGCTRTLAGRTSSLGYIQDRAAGFAIFPWVTDKLWLPVRTFSLGFRRIMAGGSHNITGLQVKCG